MSSYRELIEQRRMLDEQIAGAKKVESERALSEVRGMVADFGFTVDDVFGKRPRVGDRRTGAQPPKYRDPESGATWSGRGKRPRWLTEENLDVFRIPT